DDREHSGRWRDERCALSRTGQREVHGLVWRVDQIVLDVNGDRLQRLAREEQHGERDRVVVLRAGRCTVRRRQCDGNRTITAVDALDGDVRGAGGLDYRVGGVGETDAAGTGDGEAAQPRAATDFAAVPAQRHGAAGQIDDVYQCIQDARR